MDLFYIIKWWFFILIIGIVFLPLTNKFFSRFYDKGYLFSKTLGIAILSYTLWLFSSLRILEFNRLNIMILLILSFGVFNLLPKYFKNHKELFKERKVLYTFATVELIFLVALLFWSFLRGLKPEIDGMEKFMDLGFVNTLLKTKYMPPIDMWFAGESINYYYYGHYISAFLTKLTNIKSFISYNLMMSTLFAFTLSLTFSLVSNMLFVIKKRSFGRCILGGITSGLLIAFGGNLHAFIFGYIMPFAKKIGIEIDHEIQVRDNYWFPDATRYIGHNPDVADKTIHEFPNYSFVVSDLHAHVINIPFVLTILALAFIFIFRSKEEYEQKETIKPTIFKIHNEFILFAFLIGLFQMTNYWDFPIYITVIGISLLYVNLFKYDFKFDAIKSTLFQSILIFLFSFIISLPFTLNFENIANGIYLTPTHSKIYQLLILWGYQIFFVIYFFIFIYKIEYKYEFAQIKKSKKRNVRVTQNKNSETLSFLTKTKKIILENISVDIFILILSCCALGLILIPEIIYVKDIYSPPHHRANTMFKLTFQSFIMLCICVGYISSRVFTIKRSTFNHFKLKTTFLILIILPLIYSLFSIPSWHGELSFDNYKGLDGLNFLEEKYPEDYRVVKWFDENIDGQPTILEAAGDSYTHHARISMSTGLPTIAGWFAHEWLWRNDVNVISKRSDEVRTVYESDDTTLTKEILDKYNVEYLIIGQLEKDRYPNINIEKLYDLGEIILDLDTTKMIKLY